MRDHFTEAVAGSNFEISPATASTLPRKADDTWKKLADPSNNVEPNGLTLTIEDELQRLKAVLSGALQMSGSAFFDSVPDKFIGEHVIATATVLHGNCQLTQSIAWDEAKELWKGMAPGKHVFITGLDSCELDISESESERAFIDLMAVRRGWSPPHWIRRLDDKARRVAHWIDQSRVGGSHIEFRSGRKVPLLTAKGLKGIMAFIGSAMHSLEVEKDEMGNSWLVTEYASPSMRNLICCAPYITADLAVKSGRSDPADFNTSAEAIAWLCETFRETTRTIGINDNDKRLTFEEYFKKLPELKDRKKYDQAHTLLLQTHRTAFTVSGTDKPPLEKAKIQQIAKEIGENLAIREGGEASDDAAYRPADCYYDPRQKTAHVAIGDELPGYYSRFRCREFTDISDFVDGIAAYAAGDRQVDDQLANGEEKLSAEEQETVNHFIAAHAWKLTRRLRSIQGTFSIGGYWVGKESDGNGNPRLVTSEAKVIVERAGSWPEIDRLLDQTLVASEKDNTQRQIFLGWLSSSAKALYEGRRNRRRITGQGQALALVGAPDAGKTWLVKHLVAPIIGGYGRETDGGPYLLEGSPFNGPALSGELMLVDDKTARQQLADRDNTASRLKSLCVGGGIEINHKNRGQIFAYPWVRVVFTLNDTAKALSALPGLDSDVEDKLIMLRVSRNRPASPGGQRSGAAAATSRLEKLIKEEMPAFIHYLLHEFELPLELASERYGPISWKNAELVEKLQAISPEAGLLEALNDLYSTPIDRCLRDVSRDLAIYDANLANSYCRGKQTLSRALQQLAVTQPHQVQMPPKKSKDGRHLIFTPMAWSAD